MDRRGRVLVSQQAVSVFGYWVNDCDHDDKTEIHPPVLVAVHRVRAIPIPSTQTFDFGGSSSTIGTNVYVPGIITDIWVNRYGGGITDHNVTGLHTEVASPIPYRNVTQPSPLARKFEFNIYLPQDPRVRAASMAIPAVPLYYQVSHLSSQAPDPVIEAEKEGEITYLKVTLHLAGFTGSTYSRRIFSAWAYPSPTNWDLKRWRVKLNSMLVYDTGDWVTNGDWRFWANLNNGYSEWTKLLDGDGNVDEGTMDFGDRWQTGGSLGPDLLLFPGQRILVHTCGYEDDILYSDPVETVMDLRDQEVQVYATRGYSDGGDYTLNYEILAGPPLPQPALSPAAKALYDAYVTAGKAPLHTMPRTIPRIIPRPGFLLPPSKRENPAWRLHDMVLQPGQTDVRVPAAERERDVIWADAEAVRNVAARNPAGVEAVLRALRAKLGPATAFSRRPDALAKLAILKRVLPTQSWEAVFGDLDSAIAKLPPAQQKIPGGTSIPGNIIPRGIPTMPHPRPGRLPVP